MKHLLEIFPFRYVLRIENNITVSFRSGYYIEFLTPETTKLLGSNKMKITKDSNGENILQLKNMK